MWYFCFGDDLYAKQCAKLLPEPHTNTAPAALLGHHLILSASIGDPGLLMYLAAMYSSVLQRWYGRESPSICRSGSACCPVVESLQLVVSFFQRMFAESFMALRIFGPGLSNSYWAYSSRPTTSVLFHSLFPSFDYRSISLFWIIPTSSLRSSAISSEY